VASVDVPAIVPLWTRLHIELKACKDLIAAGEGNKKPRACERSGAYEMKKIATQLTQYY